MFKVLCSQRWSVAVPSRQAAIAAASDSHNEARAIRPGLSSLPDRSLFRLRRLQIRLGFFLRDEPLQHCPLGGIDRGIEQILKPFDVAVRGVGEIGHRAASTSGVSTKPPPAMDIVCRLRWVGWCAKRKSTAVGTADSVQNCSSRRY
jgi:hypothetical protein